MKERLEKILRRYGQEVSRGADGAVHRAFLQPLHEKRERGAGEPTRIGLRDPRLWRYLAAQPVREGEILAWRGKRFRVRSSRVYELGGTAILYRATLEAAEEAEE